MKRFIPRKIKCMYQMSLVVNKKKISIRDCPHTKTSLFGFDSRRFTHMSNTPDLSRVVLTHRRIESDRHGNRKWAQGAWSVMPEVRDCNRSEGVKDVGKQTRSDPMEIVRAGKSQSDPPEVRWRETKKISLSHEAKQARWHEIYVVLKSHEAKRARNTGNIRRSLAKRKLPSRNKHVWISYSHTNSCDPMCSPTKISSSVKSTQFEQDTHNNVREYAY